MSTIAVESEASRLVFLGGFPGGGTDLLMSLLNAHPKVFIPGEFPFLARLGDRFKGSVSAEEVDDVIAAFERIDVYRTFRNHYWVNFQLNRKDAIKRPPLPPAQEGRYQLADIYHWLVGIPPGITWTGNKTPSNAENMDRIDALFPESRFIVVTRDPRDVVITWDRKWGKDQPLTAWKYNTRMLLALGHAARLGPERVLFVGFEALLDDLEAESSRICEFLRLEWTPEILRFHEHITKRIDGKPNWGAPLRPANQGRWRQRLQPERARRIEEIAFPAMRRLGYEPEHADGPRALTRSEWAVGRMRDLYATLAVDNRYQRTNRGRVHLRNVALNVKKLTTQRSIRR